MTELNLTDYERGFLVAKSEDVLKSFDNYDGDTWLGVTVIDMAGKMRSAEYDLNIWYNDEEDRICCTAYAVTVSDNPYKVQTDGSTFTRLW